MSLSPQSLSLESCRKEMVKILSKKRKKKLQEKQVKISLARWASL